MEVLLHQWEMSPFCNKVRRILEYKGIAYRVENYNGLLARKAARLSAAGTLLTMAGYVTSGRAVCGMPVP